MPKITLLVGMIASGKSTYAQVAARAGAIIVNDDAIYTMLHGGDYTLYDKSLKLLYKSIEQHVATTAIAMGRNVIVDRGLNVSAAARRRWIGLAKAIDVPIEAIVFEKKAPETHAINRTNGSNRGHDFDHWLKAAKRHANIWVTPTIEEGFDKVAFNYEVR